MPKRTRDHNSWLFERLTDPVIAANYVNAAIEDSQDMFLVAMRNVAEARKMSRVAEEAGLNRESLYRALSEEGNPTLGTLNSVLSALGLRILVGPEESIPMTPSAANESNVNIVFNTGKTLDSTTMAAAMAPGIIVNYACTPTANLAVLEPEDFPWFLIAKEKTT